MYSGSELPEEIADGHYKGDINISTLDLATSKYTKTKCCIDAHNDMFVELIDSGSLKLRKDISLFVISISATTPTTYFHRHARIGSSSGKVVYLQKVIPLSKVPGSRKNMAWSLTARVFDVKAGKAHSATFGQKAKPWETATQCHVTCEKFLDTLTGGHTLIDPEARKRALAAPSGSKGPDPSTFSRFVGIDPLWSTASATDSPTKLVNAVRAASTKKKAIAVAKPTPSVVKSTPCVAKPAPSVTKLVSSGAKSTSSVVKPPIVTKPAALVLDTSTSDDGSVVTVVEAQAVIPAKPAKAASKRSLGEAGSTSRTCKIPKFVPKPAPLVEQTSRESGSSGRQEFLTLSASSSMDQLDDQDNCHLDERSAHKVNPQRAPTPSKSSTFHARPPMNFIDIKSRDFDTVLQRAQFHLNDLPKSLERFNREWSQLEGEGTLIQKFLKTPRIVNEAKKDVARFTAKGFQTSFEEALHRRGLKDAVNAHRLSLLKLGNAMDHTYFATNMAMEVRNDKIELLKMATEVVDSGVISDKFRDYVRHLQADIPADERALDSLVGTAQVLHEIRPVSCAGGSENVDEAERYRVLRETHVKRLAHEAAEAAMDEQSSDKE